MNALPVVQTSEGQFIDLNTMPNIKVEYLLSSSEAEKKARSAEKTAAGGM